MIPELTVFLTAMIPFLELKLAIPLGHSMGISSINTLLFAVAGTIIPSAITLGTIGPLSDWSRKKSKKLDNLFQKLFKKTRKEHSKNFVRFGAIFLIALVAIPLPGSGTVTGATVSFLFGVDYWKALTLIVVGSVISGILVTGGVASITALFNLIKG